MYKYDYKKILNSISPLDFFESEGLRIKNKSGTWVGGGLCPFHTDNTAGSFFINLSNGAFNCFSCGSKGSNIISFYILRHDISFKKAIKILSDDYTVKL